MSITSYLRKREIIMSDLNVTKKDTLPIKIVKMGLAYYYAGVVMMAVGTVAHIASEALKAKASKAE